MELKKNPKADLETRRGLYLEIGLVAILAVALVAFNVRSYEKEAKEVSMRTADSEIEDIVLQTKAEEPPPPPPEEPEMVVTDVKVVENDAVLTNEVGIIDAGTSNAQNQEVAKVEVAEEVEEEEEEIFMSVEENPEFPGGLEAVYKFVGQNLKYPELAKQNNITGKVYIQFVVEKDGSVGNVKVLRDIGGGCGAEALRVVKMLPKWKPGKQRGKAVRCYFTLPVVYELN